jgi:hypothetical protein
VRPGLPGVLVPGNRSRRGDDLNRGDDDLSRGMILSEGMQYRGFVDFGGGGGAKE